MSRKLALAESLSCCLREQNEYLGSGGGVQGSIPGTGFSGFLPVIFWIIFGSRFKWIRGSQMDPISLQNTFKNMLEICHFSDSVSFRILEFFRWLLRAFLSLLGSSWGGSRLEKYVFCIRKTHFLYMLIFGTLKLLDVLLGFILVPLGPF